MLVEDACSSVHGAQAMDALVARTLMSGTHAHAHTHYSGAASSQLGASGYARANVSK